MSTKLRKRRGVTAALLIKKMGKIGEENNPQEVMASLGWLSKFKQRHILKFKRFHGKIFQTDIKTFKQKIKTIEASINT